MKAYIDRVEVVAGDLVIARHARGRGRGEWIVDPLHYVDEAAAKFERNVESLLSAVRLNETPDEKTRKWLAGLDPATYAKLAAVGMVKARESLKIGAFLDSYIDGRADLKPSTVIAIKQTRRDLVEFFGSDRDIREISEGDADEWRQSRVKRGLGMNTVRRRCG